MDTSIIETIVDNSLKEVISIHGCEVFELHIVVARTDGTIITRYSNERPWEYPHDEIAILKLAYKLHGCVPPDRTEFFDEQLKAAQDRYYAGVASSANLDLVVACSSTPQWFAGPVALHLAQRLTHRP